MNASHSAEELIVFALESRKGADLPAATLIRIEQTALRFNALMGLTGELHLRGESFSLVVEGPSKVVQPLAGRILADPRHRSIRVTAFGRLAERRFGGWGSSGFPLHDRWEDFLPANLLLMPRVGRQPPLQSVAGGR